MHTIDFNYTLNTYKHKMIIPGTPISFLLFFGLLFPPSGLFPPPPPQESPSLYAQEHLDSKVNDYTIHNYCS